MKQISVDFSRIIGTIKPMHSVNNGPASYAFESTDRCLKDIIDADTKVFYRLGTSIEQQLNRD